MTRSTSVRTSKVSMDEDLRPLTDLESERSSTSAVKLFLSSKNKKPLEREAAVQWFLHWPGRSSISTSPNAKVPFSLSYWLSPEPVIITSKLAISQC